MMTSSSILFIIYVASISLDMISGAVEGETEAISRHKRQLPLKLDCNVLSMSQSDRCYKGDLIDESIADCEKTFSVYTCDPINKYALSTTVDVPDVNAHGVNCLPVSGKPVRCGDRDTCATPQWISPAQLVGPMSLTPVDASIGQPWISVSRGQQYADNTITEERAVYIFMLVVTTATMTIRRVMVTLTKEAEPLMIYAQNVATGSFLNKHHVILTHSTVAAVHNNASVGTIVMINIYTQNPYLAFAPNG